MAKRIQVGGRIESKEVGGIVTGAAEILDDEKGKKQSVINGETDDELLRLDQSKQDNLTFDNAPTEGSDNPVKSGGVYAADKALSDAIEAILLLIPSAASALNKLVDTAMMNSSISTATATFKGTYNVVTDLSLTVDATHEQIAAALGNVISTADNNDYAFVQIPVSAESTDIRRTERYKFNGTTWGYEYDLNTSGFTAAQWAALNSGITIALVGKLIGLPTSSELQALLGQKQDTLTFDNIPVSGSANPVKSGGVYSSINDEKTAREQLAQTVTGIDGRVGDVEKVIPAGAADNNKLVANNSMEAYVTSIIEAITASFTIATADGHINLTLTQTNGRVASLTLTSSDIASAQALTALTGRVSTAEDNITTLGGRVSTNETDIANLQQLYNDLQQSKPVPVTALPSTGQQHGVIYRLAGTTSYSDYMWNGSTWVLMATYNNAIDPRPKKASQNLVTSGGVFDNMGALDVSELNATENPHTLAQYVDLSAALAAVPTDYQKGGMSIKFVQSSDNKYQQYYCKSQTFTTNVGDWEKYISEEEEVNAIYSKIGGVYNIPISVTQGTSISYNVEYKLQLKPGQVIVKLIDNDNLLSGNLPMYKYVNGVRTYWRDLTETDQEVTISDNIEGVSFYADGSSVVGTGVIIFEAKQKGIFDTEIKTEINNVRNIAERKVERLVLMYPYSSGYSSWQVGDKMFLTSLKKLQKCKSTSPLDFYPDYDPSKESLYLYNHTLYEWDGTNMKEVDSINELQFREDAENSLERYYSYRDYVVGALYNGQIITYDYSIATKDIHTAYTDLIFSVKDGYRYSISFYNGTIYSSGTGWVTKDIKIDKGTNFRVEIASVGGDVAAETITFARQTSFKFVNFLDNTTHLKIFGKYSEEYKSTQGTGINGTKLWSPYCMRIKIANGNAFKISLSGTITSGMAFYAIRADGTYQQIYQNTFGYYVAPFDMEGIGVYIADSSVASTGTYTITVEDISIDDIDDKVRHVERVLDGINEVIDLGTISYTGKNSKRVLFDSPIILDDYSKVTIETERIDEYNNEVLMYVLYSTASNDYQRLFPNIYPSGKTISVVPQDISDNSYNKKEIIGLLIYNAYNIDYSFNAKITLYGKFNGYKRYDVPELDANMVPAYYKVNDYLWKKMKVINAYLKANILSGDAFYFVTDTHWEWNQRHSPSLIKELNKKLNIQRILHGGDVYHNGELHDFYEVNCINSFRDAIGSDRVYCCRGNHEYLGRTYGDVFTETSMYLHDAVFGGPNKQYFYIDNDIQNIRYIFLWGFGVRVDEEYTYGFNDTDQMNWFKNVALSVDAGWDIFIVTHYTTSPSRTQDSYDNIPGYSNFENIVNSYNGEGRIVAILNGHTHRDYIVFGKTTAPIVITTCDQNTGLGGVDSTDFDNLQTPRISGTIDEQAFDVVVYDRTNVLLHCIRIGSRADNKLNLIQTNEQVDCRSVYCTPKSVNDSVVLPTYLTGTVNWESSDTSIATVNSGIAFCVSTGNVRITATDENGEKQSFYIAIE